MHSGSGQTYEVSGETTEWEDILIKKNIISKEEVYLNKGLNPDDVSSSEPIFSPSESLNFELKFLVP